MTVKTIIGNIVLGIVYLLVVFAAIFLVWTMPSHSDSDYSLTPEKPMLQAGVKNIMLDTLVMIKAYALQPNVTYGVQISKTHSWVANFSEPLTTTWEYHFVVTFQLKHKINDFVFLYLYEENTCCDVLSLHVEDVEG